MLVDEILTLVLAKSVIGCGNLECEAIIAFAICRPKVLCVEWGDRFSVNIHDVRKVGRLPCLYPNHSLDRGVRGLLGF